MKMFNTIVFIPLLMVFHATIIAKEITLNSKDQQTNLIELFTSEGCSSCPPADKWLNSLKDDPQLWKKIIPLAFHVDYWDYIGWKDSFAKPQNTLRQQRYQQEGGIRTVYTPGFVNNGKEWRQWFGLKSIQASNKTPGKLAVTIRNGQINAKFLPKSNQAKVLKLNVALLGFGFNNKIATGENSGRSLNHDFVVLSQTSQNSPNKTWRLKLPHNNTHKSQRLGIAIWVSNTNTQTPIQAVGGWL